MYNLIGMLPAPFMFGFLAEHVGKRIAMAQLMSMSCVAVGCVLWIWNDLK